MYNVYIPNKWYYIPANVVKSMSMNIIYVMNQV